MNFGLWLCKEKDVKSFEENNFIELVHRLNGQLKIETN